jgi:predicted metal-dependent enzyme (double-stranded beta helix superfamily)
MSLTSTDTPVAHPSTVAGPCPDRLVRAVRAEVGQGLGWQKTADRVACALRANLPDPTDLLPAQLRQGDPSRYQSHLLYSEPDGSFSIGAMVWLPGQETVIHDHVTWCVTGVLAGREYEEIFALPGDIHRVRNSGDSVAISMHVYGTDISRLGNSIRREYTLPVHS